MSPNQYQNAKLLCYKGLLSGQFTMPSPRCWHTRECATVFPLALPSSGRAEEIIQQVFTNPKHTNFGQ